MAPLPKNSIDHFAHPHPLAPSESDQEFLCDGCKTLGVGKRHRCKACDFDLHDYCGTCPRTLSSFMHPHHLTLVARKPGAAKTDRICDVCREPVQGLFYRCRECEFDVHPLCTQLPEKLNHALHRAHPLILQSAQIPGPCAVCRRPCANWRYRCGFCRFDMHLECVTEPVVAYQQNNHTTQRGIPTFEPNMGIPFHIPPQFAQFYGYPWPGYPGFGPGYIMYNTGQCTYLPGNFGPGPQNLQVPGPQNLQVPGPQNLPGPQNVQVAASNNNGNRVGKSMFSLVTRLGFGVVSNMVFGVDVTELFAASG